MKIGNTKVKVPIEVDSSDVLQSVMYWAKRNKTNEKELSKMIMSYFTEEKKMKVFGIQRNEDLSKIVAEVETDLSSLMDGSIDSSAKLFGSARKPPVEKASNEGYSRKNKGFYSYVREIVDEKKAKSLTYLSFEDLYKILLEETDAKNNHVFIKDGKPIERWRMKQYLTPSQIQKNIGIMKGIKRSKDNSGITF